RRQALTLESDRLKLEKTNVRYLSPEERADLARLIFEMEDEARDDFIKFQPRFWTQGSFQYDSVRRLGLQRIRGPAGD
ncbi:hypothetical protein Q8G81_35830, partial [Klebsiella pneumoniae]